MELIRLTPAKGRSGFFQQYPNPITFVKYLLQWLIHAYLRGFPEGFDHLGARVGVLFVAAVVLEVSHGLPVLDQPEGGGVAYISVKLVRESALKRFRLLHVVCQYL